MTAANFPACFAETETWEGWHKFSDNQHDPGGATWCGLTQRAYNTYRIQKNQSVQFVRDASDDEIQAIFHDEYFIPVRGDDLWVGLDLMVFDISINMGPVQAIKILQRALGVMVDGWFGLETLAAQKVGDRAALLYRVHLGRLGFWRRLATWVYFGKGWTNREDDIYAHAKTMLTGATT